MDRATAKEFQSFALLFEGYLRATARDFAGSPPTGFLAYAAYLAVPPLRPLLVRPGQLGGMAGLDPELVDTALKEGLIYPPVSAANPVAPDEGWHGGLLDSARILGRLEKERNAELGSLYRAWLAAERRRDTSGARKLFVASIAARTVGTDGSPLPGVGVLAHDSWWMEPLANEEAAAFSRAAAEIFATEGQHEMKNYSAADRFTDQLLGARLCGHFEGLLKEPTSEVIAFFIEKFGPEHTAERVAVAREFGAKIATSALSSRQLWAGDVQRLLDGIHEHLALIRAVQLDAARVYAQP